MLALCSPALAGLCQLDPVPAATLLFPYLVFDFNQPLVGDNSTITIVNTAEQALLARVTLWRDTGEWVLTFNIALSGYDMERFSLRDVLHLGELPDTGTAGDLVVSGSAYPLGPQPPGAMLPGPEGTDELLPTCDPASPAYPDYPPIPQGTLGFLRDYFRWVQIWGDAGGLSHWDCVDANGDGYLAEDVVKLAPDDWFQARRSMQPTWLYVVADVVGGCNHAFPTTTLYWSQDLVRYDNVLVGDVLWIDRSSGSLEHEPAVHIEADVDIWERLSWSDQGFPLTFYSRHTGDLLAPDAIPSPDRREPLPSAWAIHYEGAGPAPGETRLRVWTTWHELAEVYDTDDSFHGHAAVDCEAYTCYAWDDDENVLYAVGGPPPPYQANLLPLAVQEVSVDEFDVPDERGWMLFQWPGTNADYDPRDYQVWMGASHRPGPGRFDVDGDGVLASGDLHLVLACVFDPSPLVGCASSDIDGSGTVDAADLGLLTARGHDDPAAATRTGTVMGSFNCGQL